MKSKVYLLSLLSFAMASFLLVHFGMIWAYGRFYIYESNLAVLLLETTLIVVILAFSFYCLIEQLRKSKASTVKTYPTQTTYSPVHRGE
jgi:type VI protein secretion system component VasK